MAQLRDTVVDGNLEVTGKITLQTNDTGIQSVRSTTGETPTILTMNDLGVFVGGTVDDDGLSVDKSSNTYVIGNDIYTMVGSVDDGYCPYYKAGDTIDFKVRAAGYVTNSGKNVVFTVPITKPVIGAPTATATSGSGFVLRQNNAYTHGSAASTYVKPTSYTVDSNYNSGFIITAVFDVTTNVINNNAIGIYWDGTITLS